MNNLLDTLHAPMHSFLSLSPYISMTITGVLMAIMLALAGVVLARMGRKPLWALLMIVPVVNAVALWVLAARKFPREKLGL